MTIFRLEKRNRYNTLLYCKPNLNLNKVFLNSAKQFLIIIKGEMLKRNCKKVVSKSASDRFKYK